MKIAKWPESAGMVLNGFEPRLKSIWYLVLNKSSVLRPLSCERNVFNYRESFILDSSAIIHSNILVRCWDSCTFGALWWIEFALTNFECAIIYFCYDDNNYSLSLSTGCIILDAQKLLELHSWRWQNHGSKCALPDVHIVASKCLFEKPLISYMHFYTIVHVWGFCFELPEFKKNAFSTFVYA